MLITSFAVASILSSKTIYVQQSSIPAKIPGNLCGQILQRTVTTLSKRGSLHPQNETH